MIDFLKFNDDISDEMLAAYIDGNATIEETELIESSLKMDSLISETIDISNDYSIIENIDALDLYEENLFEKMNFAQPLDEDTIVDYVIHEEDKHDINIHHMKPLFSYYGANNASELGSGAKAATEIFGEPGNGSEGQTYVEIWQGYDSTCAIRSQQIILRDYGIDIPQEVLMELAESNGWYSGDGGTPMGCVGYILQTAGVGVHQQMDCTVYDLINELSQGHRIIVGVDSGELWAQRSGSLVEKAKEFFEDLFHGQQGADHALIVAGIEVNPNDPSDITVVLTDPGTGDLRIEYSWDEFRDAWEDSDCFMVATNTPAPYQYDESRGMMVPSNIAVDSFIENNSYQLSPSDIYVPEGYLSAHYDEGHVDFVGFDNLGNAVSYDDFSNKFSTAGRDENGMFDRDVFIEEMDDLYGDDDDEIFDDEQ